MADYKAVTKNNICAHLDLATNNVVHFREDAPDQPILLDRYLVHGCFMRCKYDGDMGVGILNKDFLSPHFKYLAHVLFHCLGSRRGGFDDLWETIQCAFVALVLNLPFNFSEMVFTHLKENVMLKGGKKFLMYL
ncbi:hypothetical protein R6Q59_010281 [Mikania micrantha]